MYAWAFRNIFFPAYESVIRGRRTLKYLRLLEEQQWLLPDELREVQWKKLLSLLRHAEEKVPFYRERMRKAGFASKGISSPGDMRKLPPLTKRDIRENQDSLIAEGVDRRRLHASATGGSTGEPLKFMYDHDSYEWRVAGAARADRWAGWDWGCRQFYIWGAALQPVPWFTRTKKNLHNRALNMKIVSSFDFDEAILTDYVRQLNSFKPAVVVGYTNAVYEFARFCRDRKLSLWRPRGVIVSAERLLNHQREIIAAAFNTEVFDRYGCRETMNIAAECDHHRGLHLNADNLLVEIEKDALPAKPGELGEVLVTDLNNYSMPFIRYQNGDMAVAGREKCSCGRGLPLLERVEGRVLDVIMTPDGHYIPGEFFPHFLKDFPGIERYQVYQSADYDVTLRIVASDVFEPAHVADIERVIRTKLGEKVRFKIERVEKIPRTEGGKLRVTISEVSARPAATGKEL